MLIRAYEFRNGMTLVTARSNRGKVLKSVKPTVQKSCNTYGTKVHLSNACYDAMAVIDVEREQGEENA